MSVPSEGQIVLQLRSGAYDSDAQALFNQISGNGCTAPTVAWKRAANTLIIGLKAQDLWSHYDRHLEFDAADSCTALIDWAHPSFSETITGSCVFTANIGFTGDSATCLLNDSNQNALGGQCTLNDCGFMLWARTIGANGNAVLGSPSTVRLRLGLSTTAQTNIQVINTSPISPGAGTGGAGDNADDRISNSEFITTFNGVQKADTTGSTSFALQAQPVTLFGNAGSFSNTQLSGWNIGKHQTVPQRLAECQLEAAFHIATGAISVAPC